MECGILVPKNALYQHFRDSGSLKGIDMVKSWPGQGQKYNLLYSTASTHPVSLCS